MRIHATRLSIVAVAALSVLGCSNDSTPGVTESAVDAVEERLDNPEDASRPAWDEFISECMSENGFDYIPTGGGYDISSALSLDDRAFNELYGYGISTLIPENAAAESAANAEAEQSYIAWDAAYPSEEAKAEYHQQLGTCEGEAFLYAEYPAGGFSLSAEPGSAAELASNMRSEAQELAQNDERFLEVLESWRTCMQSEGFAIAQYDNLTSELSAAVEPIRQSYISKASALVESGESWDALDEAQVLSEGELSELQTLQSEEMGLASADLKCQDDGYDVQGTLNALIQEHLEKILDEQ